MRERPARRYRCPLCDEVVPVRVLQHIAERHHGALIARFIDGPCEGVRVYQLKGVKDETRFTTTWKVPREMAALPDPTPGEAYIADSPNPRFPSSPTTYFAVRGPRDLTVDHALTAVPPIYVDYSIRGTP